MNRRWRGMLWAAVALCTGLACAADPNDVAVSSSLRLPVSRQAPLWWESARQQFQQGQRGGAFALLEQLQRDAPQLFIVDGSTAATTDALIEQFVEQLPPEQRQQWEAAVKPRAEDLWNRWREQRQLSDLRLLCLNFGSTPIGLNGWRALAAVHRDAGQRQLAVAAYDVVLRHRHATAAERASAVLAQAELWYDLGREDRIADLQRYHDQFPRTMVRLNGQAALFSSAWSRWRQTHPPIASDERVEAAATTWTHRLPMLDELQSLWDKWAVEYRSAGVWLLPANEPLVVNQHVITRSLMGLEACDIATGELRWQTPPTQEFSWLQTNPGFLENQQYRRMLVEQLYRRALANSILGRLTTNGELVFAINDPRGIGYGATSQRPPDWPAPTTEPRLNFLSAWNSQTGDMAWRIGGESAGPTYPLAGVYFCGPPTIIDDQLFVIAQQQGELRLLALQVEDGHLAWSLSLGETPKALAEDPRRQRVACPVLFHAGRLICSTAAGAIVAVDPLTRSLQWAWRYPVEARVQAIDPRDNRTVVTPDAWWDGWRDVGLVAHNGVVVCSSPESNRLFALDVLSGQPRWTALRDGGLIQLAATDDGVLIAEPTAIRAQHLDTGALRWRTPIGELTGRPLLLGNELLVPAEPRGLVTLRTADGSITETRTVDRSVGNLARSASGLVAASVHEIGKLPIRSETLTPAAHRAALLAELDQHPDRWSMLAASLDALSEKTSQRIEVQLAIARAAARAGEVDEAADRLLALSEQISREEFLLSFNPRRLVRADLAVVAAWDDLYRAASVSDRELLDGRLNASWTAACKNGDPFAPQRWREFWQPLPFARQRQVFAEPRVFLGQPMLAVELALLSRPDPALRWQLSEELARAGFHREADDYRRELLREHPGAIIADDMTVATALQRRDWSTTTRDPWPAVIPQVEVQKDQLNDHVHHFTVPLDGDSSPLFERLDVTLDRQGKRLRFSGAGQRGAWELTLPPLSPVRFESLRYIQEMVRGWGRGRVLILRVGADLFAVAPFDDRGEPSARLLWSLSLLDSSVLQPEQILLAVPGPNDESPKQVDPFGRPVGQVGPVRASYLCCQESGRLVCLETLTGRKRCERFDLPLDAVLSGDDEHIAIWSAVEQRVEWLRATDGAALGRRHWNAAPEEIVLQHDVQVWRQLRNPPQLICENVVTADIRWRRELPPGGKIVALDSETFGIADPVGVLHVWNAADGSPRGEPIMLEVPAALERMIVSRDPDRWYIAFAERTGQPAALRLNQNRQGYRVPIITGPLYAIDRNRSAVDWHVRLDREAWPLDQPRALPILLQTYRTFGTSPALASQPVTEGVLHVRDKRTGHALLHRNDLGALTFTSTWGDPDRGVVEIAWQKETIRLRYQPAPPPPAMPTER